MLSNLHTVAINCSIYIAFHLVVVFSYVDIAYVHSPVRSFGFGEADKCFWFAVHGTGCCCYDWFTYGRYSQFNYYDGR